MTSPAAEVAPISSQEEACMVLWAITHPQKTFLTDWLHLYRTALGQNNLGEYWPELRAAWVKRWPTAQGTSVAITEEVRYFNVNDIDRRALIHTT